MSLAAEEEGSTRPKLSLQPRSSSSDAPSATSFKSTRPNPFGAARPKEQVIAEREGKQETEVLKEQADREWKSQVLTDSQREEKKAVEAELSFAKSALEKETDVEKAALLIKEVAIKESNLEQLLASFEKLAAQPSPSAVPKHTHDKRREDRSFPILFGGAYGAGSKPVFVYGDAWGGSRKLGKSNQCYTCGEYGHMARECSHGGSYNFGGGSYGGKNGSRVCYKCGEGGHLARACPLEGGSGYGNMGGFQYGYEHGSAAAASYYGGNQYNSIGYNGPNYGGRRNYEEGRR